MSCQVTRVVHRDGHLGGRHAQGVRQSFERVAANVVRAGQDQVRRGLANIEGLNSASEVFLRPSASMTLGIEEVRESGHLRMLS